MHGEDRLNIKMQLIIGALKLAEFPDHISIDYGLSVHPSIHPSTCGGAVVTKTKLTNTNPNFFFLFSSNMDSSIGRPRAATDISSMKK